jgi:DNA-3-methyladenine glycosylase II
MLGKKGSKSKMYKSTFNIKALVPFDFHLSSHIFSDGDKNIRKYANNHFWQAVNVNDKILFLYIESVGDLENPELAVSVESEVELSPEILNSTPIIVYKIFNLGLDLRPFYEAMQKDEIMNEIVKQLYGLKNPSTPTLFEAVVDSIVEQQISLKAAHNIENRVIKNFGSSIDLYGQKYYSYPQPEDLAHLDLQKLRDCGLSFRKAEYIRDLSQKILNNDVDFNSLEKMDSTEEMIEEIIKIRGIGVWTAELALLRGLGRLDAIPADDIGLQRVISHFYREDEKISAEELREIAISWGKWKGLASYYLIVAELMNIEI